MQFKQQNILGEENTGGKFKKKQNTSSNSNMYEAELNLYEVDQYAVGYYACYDDTVNDNEILNHISEEPNNTQHITYIYIYVNGEP